MGQHWAAGKRFSRWALCVPCLSVLFLVTVGAQSALAQQDITSSGPINNIWLTDDLGCQATQVGDTSGEFYSGGVPAACGTFVADGRAVYGPASVPGGPALTPFTPTGQTGVLGNGTSSPYQVTTNAALGSTGLSVSQVDSYVVGQPYYRTDITVFNDTSTSGTVTVYHAGDCYLQGSDFGYGWIDSTNGGIYCSANPNNSPAGSTLGFQALTSGSHFFEGLYSTMWGLVAPFGGQFPNGCDCNTDEDNAAGLSWSLALPAFSSATVSLLTVMSPSATPTTTPTPTPTSPGQPSGISTPSVGQPGQPAGTPVLGKSFNAAPVSGQVLVKVPGSGFVPLSEARLLPAGTQVDTLSGKLELISATGNKGKKAKKLQSATFNGAVFSVSQARSGRNKGLLTATLLQGSCAATKAGVGPLASAAISGSARATLNVHSGGKTSSRGHYGSATSRGTAWTITDSCTSTLIAVQKDTVLVHDFVHHKTLTLRAGQRYLIRRK